MICRFMLIAATDMRPCRPRRPGCGSRAGPVVARATNPLRFAG